jgi:Mn2+/Fe2+ NRAMP family transporter
LDEGEEEKDGKGKQKDTTPDNKIVTPNRETTSSFRHVLKSLGPGVITGASDDDSSGIATYSQAGAQFGFGMLWMAIFQYPMMTVIQEICARIGPITGSGLTAVIKGRYSKKVVLPLTSLRLIANTINIGADIGVIAASVRLVFPQLPIIVSTLFYHIYNSFTNSSAL